MNKNEIIKRYSQDHEDRLMLAQVLDKLEAAEQKNIPVSTKFLNEHQRALAEKLLANFGNPRHLFFGGYDGAMRTLLIFLPEYLDINQIFKGDKDDICPVAFIRAEYLPDKKPSHRDFLGSMLGSGIKREAIGDILVGQGSCDIIVLKEVLSYILANLQSVGRVKVETSTINADLLKVPEAEFKLIKDTVASFRLDNLVSAGFTISRDKACSFVKTGRVSLNFLECVKVDKQVTEGDIISLRGMGKIELQQIGHQTKKGRTAVVIKKYV